jgi:hypothetical protein
MPRPSAKVAARSSIGVLSLGVALCGHPSPAFLVLLVHLKRKNGDFLASFPEGIVIAFSLYPVERRDRRRGVVPSPSLGLVWDSPLLRYPINLKLP